MGTGLDDVLAADTVLSDVDGDAGRLVIRGHRVEELAQHWRFESLLALLFEGFFDAQPTAAMLGQARVAAFARLPSRDEAIVALPPIDALRALMARLPDGDGLEPALVLIAAPAVFTAAHAAWQRGEAPIAPDPQASHATDVLRMMALDVSPQAERALESYLVTVADHGLNASTFAARVVSSTQAGLVSAVLAAISALKGPLHGGAPGPVLDMLDAIGEASAAVPWLEAAVVRGERLMGFGHRIYRVRDPRADALAQALSGLGCRSPRLALARAVEQAALDVLQRMKPGRDLQTNVEFFTALLLDALGFDRGRFTCVFAMGRVVGWLAHAREQRLHGRLMRPRSRYVGPLPLELVGEAGRTEDLCVV